MKPALFGLVLALACLGPTACALPIPFVGEGGDSGGTGDGSEEPQVAPAASPTTLTCAHRKCDSFKLGGLFDMEPCCAGAGSDQCGVTVTEITGDLLGVSPGCHRLAAPGSADTSCPDFEYSSPVDEGIATWPGCRAPDGECGALIDATPAGGPDLGCATP